MITKGIYDLDSEPWVKISFEAKDIIRKLININPEQRLSAKEALEHSWFRL